VTKRYFLLNLWKTLEYLLNLFNDVLPLAEMVRTYVFDRSIGCAVYNDRRWRCSVGTCL